MPAATNTARAIQPETILESEERFIAIQPPRCWQKISPAPHRRTPAGSLGKDIVTRLKLQEARGAAI